MLNQAKLKNVKQKDGKIEAQCPACAASGADATGNHLVVFPDGKFSCVAYPGDKEHRQLIFKLVGVPGKAPALQLTIQRQKIPESAILMKIGQIGQQNPTPAADGRAVTP